MVVGWWIREGWRKKRKRRKEMKREEESENRDEMMEGRYDQSGGERWIEWWLPEKKKSSV